MPILLSHAYLHEETVTNDDNSNRFILSCYVNSVSFYVYINTCVFLDSINLVFNLSLKTASLEKAF